MSAGNIVFVDRTGGLLFRTSYTALSERYRVIWSDTAEHTLSHVGRLGPDVHCVVMAADEVSKEDSLSLVSRLRKQGVPVVASCATLGQAIALLSAGAQEVLRRPHTTKELLSRVNAAAL
jgi:DNA-binding response OmpR family regulator